MAKSPDYPGSSAGNNISLTAVQKAQLRWHHHGMDTDVLEAFAEYQLSQRLSVKTVKTRESLLKSFQNSTGIPLTQATVRDLRAYLGRPHVSPATARTARNAFKAFYTFAVEDGYIDANPADRLPPIQVPRAEPRPFTPEQIEALLASGSYKRTRAMILLGYYQGFRVSQIARVRGDDIDLLSDTIRTIGKGNKDRRLPLHPVIRDLATDMPGTGWWFPARRGAQGHINGGAVSDLIRRAKQRAGITDPRLTAHSLRHSFGSHLVERGVDIRVVQELMMHESLTSTQVYTHVSEKRKRDSLAAIPSLPIPERAYRKAA